MAMVVRMLKPVGAWLLAAAVVGGGAAWLAANVDRTPPEAPAVVRKVEVPIRPVGFAAADAHRVTVTARWGYPALDGADREQISPMQWDGYLSLDCGAVERVEPLGLEQRGTPTDDRVGPVVRGDLGDQRVYWRSRTGGDWDGLRVQVAICTQEGGTGTASSLRLVTPQRTYVARLDWSVDDFVSMRIGQEGHSLDVHISAINDFRTLRGARVTAVVPEPEAPDAGRPEAQLLSEVPALPEPVPERPL